MVVNGKYKSRYVLSRKPARTEYDGVVYQVPGKAGVCVKYYNQGNRSAAQEKMVVDSINGVASIQGYPQLIEPVYASGCFVGFAFREEYAPEPVPVPVQAPVKRDMAYPMIRLMILLVPPVLISLVMVLFLFDHVLADMMIPAAAYYNFHGIPMLVVGWIALVATYVKTVAGGGYGPAFMALAAFCGGMIATFVVIRLVIALVMIFVTFVNTILPTLVSLVMVVIVLVVVAKALLNAFR